MDIISEILTVLFANREKESSSGDSGGTGGTGGATIENVSVLVADFAETESLTVLSGAYYGTKQAIVS